ncbi:exopolysaccharide biosynthesis protein [Pacificoceanicola onchidii]|uniref:exopolysaccharide biosynthesis protein n=1 Tax=Pacificoceanicola onchidii TaxID=2562685 RepID=UPI0010A651E1|nr:exopolysaccharide biosynthesis protein [Pacificoceanicola onchidii]
MNKAETLSLAAATGDMDEGPSSLCDVLDRVAPQGDEDRVSVEDMLRRIGTRSFPAIILAPSVLLVSPLSGIPTVPSLAGLLVAVLALQALLGRAHLWLPGFLTRRQIGAAKLQRGLNWLRKPAGWMDRYSQGRLRILSSRPLRWIAYLVTFVLALSWPLLEIVPFVTSFSAGAVSMIMFGLMTRDGIYILAGYVQSIVLYSIVVCLWAGVL